MSVLLFLNGAIGSKPNFPDVNDYHFVYCCDGAYDYLVDNNIAVDGVIGDFDSVRQPIPENLQIYLPNQNHTDFEKSIQYLLSKGHKIVDVYFASGGEMDHFLGNLQIAAKYHSQIKINFYDDNHRYFFITNSKNENTIFDELNSFNKVINKTLSIIPYPTAIISSIGLQYELSKTKLSANTQFSLRNKIISSNVDITIHSGSAFIFINH